MARSEEIDRMSKQRGTGLAAFAIRPVAVVATPSVDTPAPSERQRGKGAMVSLTVRVTREQWERLHELGLHEGRSINQLAIDGFSRLFVEKGLKAL